MTTPEARARQKIDARLTVCGWVVQDRARMNLYAGQGAAVREFPLQTGYADYLLFVDHKAAGVAGRAEAWSPRHYRATGWDDPAIGMREAGSRRLPAPGDFEAGV